MKRLLKNLNDFMWPFNGLNPSNLLPKSSRVTDGIVAKLSFTPSIVLVALLTLFVA